VKHQLRAKIMDILAGESHPRIAVEQLLEGGRNAFDAKLALALEDFHLQRLAGHREQMLHERDRLRRAGQNHEAGGSADHGLGPGSAPIGVTQHLNLVDHSDIDDAMQIQRLDGAGDMRRLVRQNTLLARHHAGGKALLAHALVMLQREEPQG
jgi:hypothetical protein